MTTELDDLIEHFERFRAVTLQILEIISDEDLAWRPDPNSFSCGQQLLHIAQAEDLHSHGLLEGDWDFERVRLRPVTSRADLRTFFEAVRQRTLPLLRALETEALSQIANAPGLPVPMTLRSCLWFIVEHEIHHKAQLSVYLKQMGYVAPFYAMPLTLGERPDIAARQELGGF